MTTAAAPEGAPTRGQLRAGSFDELVERALERRAVTHLIVSDGLNERWLELGAGLLRLTAVGPRRGRGLLETILEHPALAPETANHLQAAMTTPRGGDGEDPVEQILGLPGVRRIADECRRVIVLDELIDTIVWEGAEFELHERVPPGAPPLDAGHAGLVLSSGAADLMAQVRALSGEWAQLCKRLGAPSRTWVRRSSKPEDPSIETLETVLLSLLPPAGCTLDDVILGFRQSGPDALVACRTAVALSERGLVTLDLDPPAAPAEQRAALARAEVAQLEPLVSRVALPVHALRRLARRQEEAGDLPRAVEAWCKAGALLATDGGLEEAAVAYREALRLSPRAAFARERLAAVQERLGPADAAAAAWLEAAQGHADLGIGHGALRALRRAAQLAPGRDDIERRVHHALAAIGRREEAARACEELAHRLESAGVAAAGACWQDLHQLAPDHPTARKRWRAAAARQGFAATLAALTLVAASLVGGAAWLHARRRDLDHARALAADVEPLLRAGRVADARANVTALEGRGSLAGADLDRVRPLLDAVVADEGAAALARAAAHEAAGRLADARRVYSRLEVELRGTGSGQQAMARLGALAADEQQAQREVDLVAALAQDPSKVAEAFARGRDLLRRHGRTEAARALRLPLEVTSTRAGARVTVDGQAVGVTPCVVLRSATPFVLEVTQDGYQPRRLTIDLTAPDLTPTLRVDPQLRAVRWQVPTLGPLTAPPLVGVAGLVLAGSDQRVHGIAHDGAVRWTARLAPFAAALGSPIPIDDDVAVVVEGGAATGGRALALDVRTGAARWSRDLDGAEPRAVGALDGGALVSSPAGRLLLLDGRTGAPRWTVELGSPLALPPILSAARAVAVTEDGRVHLVDAQGRREPLQVPGPLAAAPVGTARGWVVGAASGEVSLLPAPNVSGWSRRLAQPLGAPPLIVDGLALVVCGSRLTALSLHDGALRWERDLGSPLGPPGGRPGVAYVGAADGTVHAVATQSGQTLWSFRADGAVRAAPLAHRGVVFVASEGGALSAILEPN